MHAVVIIFNAGGMGMNTPDIWLPKKKKKHQCFFKKVTQEWKAIQLRLTPYSSHVVSKMVYLFLQSTTTQQSYSVQEVCNPMQEAALVEDLDSIPVLLQTPSVTVHNKPGS